MNTYMLPLVVRLEEYVTSSHLYTSIDNRLKPPSTPYFPASTPFPPLKAHAPPKRTKTCHDPPPPPHVLRSKPPPRLTPPHTTHPQYQRLQSRETSPRPLQVLKHALPRIGRINLREMWALHGSFPALQLRV